MTQPQSTPGRVRTMALALVAQMSTLSSLENVAFAVRVDITLFDFSAGNPSTNVTIVTIVPATLNSLI